MITQDQKMRLDQLFEKYGDAASGRRIIEDAIKWYERKAAASKLVFTPLFPMTRDNLAAFSAVVLLFQYGYTDQVRKLDGSSARLLRDGKLGPHTLQALKDVKAGAPLSSPAAAFAFPIIVANASWQAPGFPQAPGAEPGERKTNWGLVVLGAAAAAWWITRKR